MTHASIFSGIGGAELAKYAGVQFIELYANFCFRADGKAQ